MNICIKTRPGRGRNHAGITLIECLVYISLLGVVVTSALIGFNRCWDNSKRLRHNAEDIVRALHAGEQWRADVRGATGAIRVADEAGDETVTIPQGARQVLYHFSGGMVQRQTGTGAAPMMLVDRVKSSVMQADARPHAAAWRWELELLPAQKNAHVVPLFTFESVAGHAATP